MLSMNMHTPQKESPNGMRKRKKRKSGEKDLHHVCTKNPRVSGVQSLFSYSIDNVGYIFFTITFLCTSAVQSVVVFDI